MLSPKPLLFPLVVVTLVASLGSSHLLAYRQGRIAERAVQEMHTAAALQRAALEAERIRDQDLAILTGARDRETVLRERIREVRIDVPSPDCRDLGPDWLHAANEAIAATHSPGLPGAVP
jgi:hypothetical protein